MTCDARILRHPERAAEEIHEVVRAMHDRAPARATSRSTATMVDIEIPVPEGIREWDGSFPRPRSDPRKLAEAVADTLARLRAAKRPMLIGGVELYRERRGARLPAPRREARRAGRDDACSRRASSRWITRCTWGSTSARSAPPAIQRRVRDADLVLALGTQLTDMNLGAAKPQVRRERAVWAIGESRERLVPHLHRT